MTIDTLQLADGWLILEPVVDAMNEPTFRLTHRGGLKCETGRVIRPHKDPNHGTVVVYEPGGWTLADGQKPYRVIHARQIVGVVLPEPAPKKTKNQATAPKAEPVGATNGL